MTTDGNSSVRTKAEKLLSEIGSKYAGFIQMKSLDGMKQSFRFQSVMSSTKSADAVVRGVNVTDLSSAANSYLYSLLRSSRQHRRGFLRSLLNTFDESANTDLAELLYVADNLSAFPYQTVDEPLFLIHHIDITVVVTASSIVQSFEEHLIPKSAPTSEESSTDKENNREEKEESPSSILARLPEDLSPIENCVRSSQNCVLLLMLKQYLKELYGFTDAKLQEYSPSEPVKSYDKAVMRRANLQFYPRYAIEYLTKTCKKCFDDDHERRTWLCKHFIDFKQLLSSVDFTCNVEEENEGSKINSTMVQYSASVSIHSDENGKCGTSADDQNMFTTSSTADDASTSSLVSDVVGPLLCTSTSRERIVLTIHRQDTSKLSRDNVYADFIRPYKSQKSSFAVPVADRSSTSSVDSAKKKKPTATSIAKRKKRRRVVVDVDSDNDDSDDAEYDPSFPS
ncbi:unnamed protein product [Soboliphyme baturini]|uniref:Nipped-B protein n=1 Tax=Soboliphyme baturini TaxID=241478 RepID=A0A183INE2_9BILA|nr:unnamed protein product [Soboliphyme baturini]